MKLAIKVHKAVPRSERIKMPSELVEMLDAYVKFYQTEIGVGVNSEKVIVEMISRFMKSDRDFMRWYREQPGGAPNES